MDGYRGQQHYQKQHETKQASRMEPGHHSAQARYGAHQQYVSTSGSGGYGQGVGVSSGHVGYEWSGYASGHGHPGQQQHPHMHASQVQHQHQHRPQHHHQQQPPPQPQQVAVSSVNSNESLMHTVGVRGSSTYALASSSKGNGGTQPLRTKISERLQQIDREAFESEERQYQVKGEEIQAELSMILRGTHPVFIEGVSRLAAERDRTLASAEHNHRYIVDLHERAFRQERELAEQAYAAEKQAIYDRIAADIDERRKRLKEEKDSLDISMDFVFESGSRTSSKRNLRKRGMDTVLGFGDGALGGGGGNGGSASGGGRSQNKRKNNQALTMQGIGEDDIVSDLVAIRRATGVTGPLSSSTYGKKGNKGNKR
ncbi:hypothetical protein H4R99_003218 [Coemansia sp. RSA 1722]|nr:hypothetical protein H4R99_003218 [Coemansia sp. RSA 1722]